MINEFVYCPRLFHLEYVDGLFADNVDTVSGRSAHKRIDAHEDKLPENSDDGELQVARSVMLSSERLGIIARIDLIEVDGEGATPVDTKKGHVPDVPGQAYDPEKVQLCAQALLLREHGMPCDHGYLYYAQSRTRIRVDFDEALERLTRQAIADARAAGEASAPPPPLVDSPKCPRCSLVGICLPDEVNYLRATTAGSEVTVEHSPGPDKSGGDDHRPRRLVPAREDAFPVYVQGYGAHIGKRGESIHITPRDAGEIDVKLKDISHLGIFGNNQITTQAIQALCGQETPISWFSSGGWFYGSLHGTGLRNVLLRQAQFRAADKSQMCLELARSFVAGKIANCRTLLMRNHPQPPAEVVEALRRHAAAAREASDLASLLGIEGNAARLYFGQFGGLLKPRASGDSLPFDFTGRNRRPPLDPVNAMLSMAYSLLVRDTTTTLSAVGFDPYVGFFHQLRHGRPALALDLMEEFRPLVGDSVVITAVNNGEARADDFIVSKAGCAMTESMRARFIQCYERRMDTLVTHPLFDYRASYRRVLEIQARLLGRFLSGEIKHYQSFLTR
ncbi:MAG: CRISPR-associated endonuclease Cas1 [Candidatus Eisenbacteria bacterium]|nr:CRISPR-associated endonuclease Cas1 [Candidatus Eisenbacteria bacterium]